MTQHKATYIGSTSRPFEKRYYNQHWSYRGKTYIVEVPTGWEHSSDYDRNGYMSQTAQHRREQEAIDAELDNPKEEPRQPKYEETAQAGFDLFWNFVDQ